MSTTNALRALLTSADEAAKRLDLMTRLLSTAPVGCVILDSAGCVRDANAHFRNRLEYDWKGEIVAPGSRFEQFLSPCAAEKWPEQLAAWFASPNQSELSRGELVNFRTKPGSLTPGAMIVSPLEVTPQGDTMCLEEDDAGERFAVVYVAFIADFPGLVR